MSNSDVRKFPRLPYASALLCVACVGVAVWLWLRDSYAWDVTSGDLDYDRVMLESAILKHPLLYRYVSLHGTYLRREDTEPYAVWFGDVGGNAARTRVFVSENWQGAPGTRAVAFGRVDFEWIVRQGLCGPDGRLILLAREGRLTGASIAGIVVGATGSLVFGLALRRWFRERRARQREAAGA